MEKNKKVYYKGHPTRGAEIIKALEELGGINKCGHSGNSEVRIYFINDKNTICAISRDGFIANLIMLSFTELTLPEPKIEFKDGDFFVVPATESSYYYIGCFNKKENDVVYCHFGMITIDNKKDFWIECHIENPYYLKLMRRASEEEKQTLLSELSKIGKVWNAEKKCIEDKVYEFKPKDWILVRNDNTDRWLLSIFSFEQHTDEYPFVTIANEGYKQCIPYEGNEHLLGTTNSK